MGTAIGVPVISIAIELGVRLLVSTKRELKMRGYRDQELTYAGIGRVLLGRLGFSMVMVTIAAAQFGACIAYVIFVEETCFEFYSGIPKWGYALIMCAIQFALCNIRNVRNLQYTSALGNLLVLLVVLTIYVYNLHTLGETGAQNVKPWDFNIRHFPRFIGIIAFAMEGITIVLPLESSMREPKFFMTVIDATMCGVGILLLTFGEIGYMVYGDNTNDMITKNLPRNAITTIVLGSITVNLVFTFPIQMFPVTEIIDKEVIGQENSEVAKTIERVLCVVLCTTVGIIVPDFGAILGVMGGFCFVFLGVLFPVLFYLILFEETLTTWRFWGLIVLAVVGSATSMLVTVNGIIDLVYGA